MSIKTKEELIKVVCYNPETGIFTWAYKPSKNRAIGSVVGSLHPGGYLQTTIQRKSYYLHRLAFLYMTGSLPETGYEVDHIDRNKSNNRWSNLRLVSATQNQLNKGASYNNSIGIKGISIKYRGSSYYFLCQVRLAGVNYAKSFLFDDFTRDTVLLQAKEYIEQLRDSIHQEFATHV
jgi:hypothetical protein